MDTERIAFLIVGVVVVFVVGRLIAQGGKRYLATSVPAEKASAGSSANLVAVLFHLVTLGIVALLSVLPFGGDQVQAFIVRLGLLLLVLAAIYGITLTMLNRRRQEALATELDAGRLVETGYEPGTQVRVEPVDPGLRPTARQAVRDEPLDPSAGPLA